MTTRKLLTIIAAVVIAIVLLTIIFAGGVVGLVFYSVGNSDAAVTARDFLRKNERLKQNIGEVKDFGSFVTGNINVHNSNGEATLSLKVIGERRTVNAAVELIYGEGRPWRVTAASYRNDAGQTVDLFNAYESRRAVLLLVA